MPGLVLREKRKACDAPSEGQLFFRGRPHSPFSALPLILNLSCPEPLLWPALSQYPPLV